MIIIDNYDSFTFNIVQYIKMLGIEPKVYKNDEITVEELRNKDFSSVILSPGPGRPENAGISMQLIKDFYKDKAILGVCLGYQCIAQYFGAEIVKDKEPFHGKCSKIFYDKDEALFKGMKQGFYAARYHSLCIDEKTLKLPLKRIAVYENGNPCAIKHADYPLYGVQFHPESILTENGLLLFENFLNSAENTQKK